jgi:opacity protein-like surface antigen
MDRLTTRIAIAALSACVALGAAAAVAQTKPAPAQGTLVLEPSSDGPVIAPEVRFTNFEHGGYGTLIGGYGGWLFDSKLLLGGGASFLVDHGHHDSVAGMGYGGFVAGWLLPASRVFHAGVRALVGFGQADLTDTYSYTVPLHNEPYPGPRHPYYTAPPAGSQVTQQVRIWEDFFIFEPQGTAVVRVARGVSVDVSGGYRVIAGLDSYNSWLRGFSGGVAVRIGPKL